MQRPYRAPETVDIEQPGAGRMYDYGALAPGSHLAVGRLDG